MCCHPARGMSLSAARVSRRRELRNGCIRSESPPRVHLDTPVGDRVMLLDYPLGKGETLRVCTFVAERPGVLGKSFPVS